jgi:UDP-N-acetylmuramyl pentapeptide phosphotransferase/UDP-N-acetylglucosamine-1-phosphate transferase
VSFAVEAALVLAVALASAAGTLVALRYLGRNAIMDRPNERSSHKRPTPRGAGLAVVPVIAAAWAAVGVMTGASELHWVVIAAALALAAVSWRDDVKGLHPAPRFAAHVIAVAVVLALLPRTVLVFQGALPLPFDRIATGLLWVWFINLYNFMDGIDGITGVESLSIGIGLALIAGAATGFALAGAPIGPLGLIVAAAAIGFLVWNWHPARIFLGDVGSVPMGFLIGWLLIGAAMSGTWAAALILPAYYLIDATVTLARRAVRLKPVWRAHREHFYQQAVAGGRSHGEVAAMIGLLDSGLIVLAALTPWLPLFALAAAAFATGAILLIFARRSEA